MSFCYSQKATTVISGEIQGQSQNTLPFVSFFLVEDSTTHSTDLKGAFLFETSVPLPLHLSIKQLGYIDTMVTIHKTHTLITLKAITINLNEVEITYQTEVEKITSEGFSINAIETKQYANSSTDVNQILNRSTGVNIRQKGGLGTPFEFSINGLSGKQVKLFYDGIPMDYMGPAFTLNNISPNMIERIEVYKGVVPVRLGADALGGAINIVPIDNYKSYVDASYSIGSFNTHRASLNTQYVHSKQKYLVQLNAVYNYTDNNYKIDASKPDYSTGKEGPIQEYERFHDAYQSHLTQLQLGVVEKKYADKLLIGLTYAENDKEIQHSNTINDVYGAVTTSDQTIMPTLMYKKSKIFDSKFDLKFYGGYIERTFRLFDTTAKTYAWDGTFTENFNPNFGELDWEQSLYTFKDETFFTITTLDYSINNDNIFTFNHSFHTLTREGDDVLANEPIPFDAPNIVQKNVFGFNYKNVTFKERLTSNAFVKSYHYRGQVEQPISLAPPVYETMTSAEDHIGYGFASTYSISKKIRTQFSFERSCRIPESYELFGDGVLLINNPELTPESSDNFNLGLQFIEKTDSSALKMGANFFYRNTKDMIRLMPAPRYSQFQNLADVLTTGIEVESNFETPHLLLGINATYQHLINKNEFNEGKPNPVYEDRVPNTPYLFGNLSAGYQAQFPNKKNTIRFNYALRYVNEYYLYWPSQGNKDDKFTIPSQLTHNLEGIYSINNGTLNIAFECQNIMNTQTYDHFRIQKPGRAFYLKLRYNWTK